VIDPASGHISGAGGYPGIGAGIVPPARVEIAADTLSAPDNHLTAGPNCRVKHSRLGRRSGAGGCPSIGAGIVPGAGVYQSAVNLSAPDDHFAAGPHCGVIPSGSGRIGSGGRCPTVRAGIVSPATVKLATGLKTFSPAPDDHLTAAPHSRMLYSGIRGVSGAGGNPTVGGGIVPPAGVHASAVEIHTAPDDHFATGPYCRVGDPASGRISGAGGCPGIRGGIVSAARVHRERETQSLPAPDNHLTSGPNCRVIVSRLGRVGSAGGCPCVVGAPGPVRYIRKRKVSTRRYQARDVVVRHGTLGEQILVVGREVG
jgi:hypothetical protein